jgi:RNA polymerase primary sigma factor
MPLPQERVGEIDIARKYMNEMGLVPLLTRAGEVALAQRMEAGRTGHDVAVIAAVGEYAVEQGMPLADITPDTPGLPDELEDFLGEMQDRADSELIEAGEDPQEVRVEDAERAKGEMTEANLRLVVSIAKRYQGRGLELLDLVQEGNLGLINATEKFDWRKGFKFSTYATWWIRQGIGRGIQNTGRTIRLPVHVSEDANTLAKARASIARRGDEETPETLIEETGWTLEKIVNIETVSAPIASLQQPTGDEGDVELGDILSDRNASLPDEVVAQRVREEEVRDMLEGLDDRERDIIKMRFGIGVEGGELTLEETGKKFGVTRERIRQIESKALAKLRRNVAVKAKAFEGTDE